MIFPETTIIFIYFYFRGNLDEIKIPKSTEDAFESFEMGCSATLEAILLCKEIKQSTPKTKEIFDLVVRYGKGLCRLARENKKFEVNKYKLLLRF